MLRRAWLAAPVVGLVIVVAVVLGVRHGDGARSDSKVETKPVIVGSISFNTMQPTPGGAVIATISLRSDRPLRLDALVLSVRDAQGRAADAAGRGFDFPDTGSIELGPKERTVTVAHEFQESGTYVYFLRYRRGSAWQVLPPYDTFTVG
jgi:hypothetical protein